MSPFAAVDPSPSLPLELTKHILQFCDPATLAKTSRVSLALLELSSPLLYKHIEIYGPEPLEKLLTLVADERHSELAPYLDLSFVYSLVYHDDEDRPFFTGFGPYPNFHPTRLHLPSSPCPGKLPLHLLRVVLPAGISQTQISRVFSPVVFQLERAQGVTSIPGLYFHVSGWSRLRELVFNNATHDEYFHRAGANELSDDLRVTYVLSENTTVPGAALESIIAWDLTPDEDPERDLKSLSRIRELIVHVPSEEVKGSLAQLLRDSPVFPRLTIIVNGSTSRLWNTKALEHQS